jgi:putative oxidoreductase
VRPTRPAHGHDAALLTARLVLGAVLVAHGHRALLPDAAASAAAGVGQVGVPVALAAVVAVAELLGGVLLVAGVRTAVAAWAAAVAVGAAAVVHAPTTRGGWDWSRRSPPRWWPWAAAGPGRWSATHLVRRHRARVRAPHRPSVAPPPAPVHAPGDEPVPPAGLPLIPVVRPATTPPPSPRSRTGP